MRYRDYERMARKREIIEKYRKYVVVKSLKETKNAPLGAI